MTPMRMILLAMGLVFASANQCADGSTETCAEQGNNMFQKSIATQSTLVAKTQLDEDKSGETAKRQPEMVDGNKAREKSELEEKGEQALAQEIGLKKEQIKSAKQELANNKIHLQKAEDDLCNNQCCNHGVVCDVGRSLFKVASWAGLIEDEELALKKAVEAQKAAVKASKDEVEDYEKEVKDMTDTSVSVHEALVTQIEALKIDIQTHTDTKNAKVNAYTELIKAEKDLHDKAVKVHNENVEKQRQDVEALEAKIAQELTNKKTRIDDHTTKMRGLEKDHDDEKRIYDAKIKSAEAEKEFLQPLADKLKAQVCEHSPEKCPEKGESSS